MSAIVLNIDLFHYWFYYRWNFETLFNNSSSRHIQLESNPHVLGVIDQKSVRLNNEESSSIKVPTRNYKETCPEACRIDKVKTPNNTALSLYYMLVQLGELSFL